MESLQGIEKLLRRVHKLGTDIRHVERPMKAAGTYMIGSIVRNFNAGGRPQKWQDLAASTVAHRRRGGGEGGIRPLVDTGRLRNSNSMRLRTDGVEVGTNMVQAKRQHFGFPKGTGRGHAKTPKRPFMLLQTEDMPVIGNIFSQHLRG